MPFTRRFRQPNPAPGHARDPHVFPTRRSPEAHRLGTRTSRVIAISRFEKQNIAGNSRRDHPDRTPREVTGMVGGPGPIRTADLTLIRRAL
jgi:hypothetical protein